MDDKIVKKTQDSLGKIIKKPPLTEKLLKKPPFRFLHDILTSVIKNTGTMKGLYTENELNSDQIKDKDSKMAFLQKAVDFVSLVVGKSLSVRPSKIVAGHEPEKTNEFLQELATACSKKIDNDDFVKRALKGEKPGESSKPPRGSSKREEKKDKESRDEKRRERDGSGKENRERQGSGSRDRGKEREKDDRKEKESRSSKDREGSRDRGERERSRDRRDREKDKENKEDRKKDENSEDRHRDRDRERDKDAEKKKEEETPPVLNVQANGDGNESATPEADVEAPSEPPAARIPRPSSAKGSRRRHREGRGGMESSDEDEDEQFRAEKRDDEAVNGTVGEDDLPPQVMAARRMARPASARPAPPKVKPKTDTVQEPDIRVGSGKRVTNVIVDDDNPSDDDDNFMVEDTAIPPPEPEPVVRQSEVEEDSEHGGLVKKMLETKKELEGGSQTAGARKEVEKPMVSDAARRKEREMVQKEIDKLRGSIQTLTRSANPLGKIMDYVQEDLDSMQKENEKWKKENKEHTLSLKQEQSVTERSIEPLKGQLKDLDQLIGDQLVLIAAVKSNIMRNDEKIGKMLGSVSKS